MRIEVGAWLQPKDEDNRDGTLSRVDHVVIKNKFLDRIYCTQICAGFELGRIKIMANDIDSWVIVNIKSWEVQSQQERVFADLLGVYL